MKINKRAPHFILATVLRIYPELSHIIGSDWESIKPRVDSLILQLSTEPNRRQSSIELMELLSDYDDLQTRIREENTVQAIICENIKDGMAEIAHDLGLDPSSIEGLFAATLSKVRWSVDEDTIPETEIVTKTISIKPGGEDGVKSVKFKNMDIDMGDFAKISAGFVTTGFDILDKPHPLLIAAGLILTVAALYDTMAVKLSEQDASVFWAFIYATSHKVDRKISETDLLHTTNSERKKYGREPISELQLKQSLLKLQRINSIRRLDTEMLEVIEDYRVED